MSALARTARTERPNFAHVPSVSEYKRANVRINLRGESRQASPDSLGDVAADIVEAEGAIHMQELSRRVTEAAYPTHAGSRIRAVIEAAARSMVRARRFATVGTFSGTRIRDAPCNGWRSTARDLGGKRSHRGHGARLEALRRVTAKPYEENPTGPGQYNRGPSSCPYLLDVAKKRSPKTVRPWSDGGG